MRRAVLMALSLLLIAVPCFAASGRAMPAGTACGELDLRNGTVVSYEQMVTDIARRKGLSVEEVKREIPDIAGQLNASGDGSGRERTSYTYDGLRCAYFYLRDSLQVTEEYRPTISLYCAGWYHPKVATMKTGIVEIVNADLEREYKGVTKQFAGTLFVHLQSEFRLHWDINGDFFDNGATSVEGGGQLNLKTGEGGRVIFRVDAGSELKHYKYCHTYGDIRYGG